MLIAWARDVGPVPKHSGKFYPSPKYVFHLSPQNVCWAQMLFDFETCSGGLELSNTACLLLASMISAATSQTSRHTHPNLVKWKYVTEAYRAGLGWAASVLVQFGCYTMSG
jgi:hypothetical protein